MTTNTKLSEPPFYDNSVAENSGPRVVGVTVAFEILATLALVLRLLSRKLKKASFLLSDYVCILGLLGSWVEAGLIFAG